MDKKKFTVVLEGVVLKVLQNRMCIVSIDIQGEKKEIVCFFKGKMNKSQGDRVEENTLVEVEIDERFALEDNKGIVIGIRKSKDKKNDDFLSSNKKKKSKSNNKPKKRR